MSNAKFQKAAKPHRTAIRPDLLAGKQTYSNPRKCKHDFNCLDLIVIVFRVSSILQTLTDEEAGGPYCRVIVRNTRHVH